MISDLLTAIAARLQADERFVGPPKISVVVREPGDWQRAIDETLGKFDLVVVLVPPRMRMNDDRKLEIQLSIVIGENAGFNRGRSGKVLGAEDLALVIAALLHDWQPSDEWSPIQFREGNLTQATDPVSYQLDLVTVTHIQIVNS